MALTNAANVLLWLRAGLVLNAGVMQAKLGASLGLGLVCAYNYFCAKKK